MDEDKARKKIVDAIQEGNVKWHPDADEAFERGINFNDPDGFELVEVYLDHCWGPCGDEEKGNKGGFEVRYVTKSCGFGGMRMVLLNDGTLECDNEAMDRDFLKKVLCKLVDDAKLRM